MKNGSLGKSNADIVLEYLESRSGAYCDDCLFDQTGVEPRQQICQICTSLAKKNKIERGRTSCALCGRCKLASSFSIPPLPKAQPQRPTDVSQPEKAVDSTAFDQLDIEMMRTKIVRMCREL